MAPRSLFSLLLVACALSCSAVQHLPAPSNNLEDDPLFNTSNLLNYPAVSDHLKEHYQAEEITFTTEDKFKLNGLWIPRKDAQCTTIAAAGFYPGRKEGMATFIKLIPEKSNLLLFDARGHGNSDGSCAYLWRTLPNYGIHEYRDVIAAMACARAKVEKPLCMLGMCAGGFHTIRALTQLKNRNELDQYDVKGVILDSTFTSCKDVIPAADYHVKEKLIPQLLRSFVYTKDTSKKVKERWIYSLLWYCIGKPVITVIKWFGGRGIEKHDAETRICKDINAISEIPVMFIHAQEDSYVHIDDVKALKDKHSYPNPNYIRLSNAVAAHDELHIFTNSDHTANHIKHKQGYQQKIYAFFKRVGLIIDNMAV